jgi:hypothetical protein
MAKDQGPGTSPEAWEILNASQSYVLNWMCDNCVGILSAREPHYIGKSLPEITDDYNSVRNINAILEKLWSAIPVVRRVKLLSGNEPYFYYVSFEEFAKELKVKIETKEIQPRKLQAAQNCEKD